MRPVRAASLYWRQTGAICRKNLLSRSRSWEATLLQLLQSLFVIFLIWAVDKAISYSSSQFTGARAQRTSVPQAVGPIPACNSNIYLKADQPCLSIIYTPKGNPVVEQIMAGVMMNNQPSLSPHVVKGMDSQDQVDAFLLHNPQVVLSAVHFRQVNNQSWKYVLQTNSTVSYFKGQFQDPNMYIQIPLQVAIEREFARWSLKSDLGWRVSTRAFPHPSLTSSSVVGRVAPVFLLASLLMNTVLLMQEVIGERETGLRGAMTSMGLMDSAYWSSILMVEVVVTATHAGLLTVLAIAFRFDLATKNSPALLFLLLFTSALSLNALALVLSNLVRRVSMAVPTCLVVFIIAWVFMIVLSFGFPYNGSAAKGLVALFSLFPWSILSKGLLDLADATTGTKAGISWSQRSSYCWSDTPPAEAQAHLAYWKSQCALPLADAFWVLMSQAGGYLVLALYLDQVIPREPGGSHMHWAFPVLPSTWVNLFCPSRASKSQHAKKSLEAARRGAALAVTSQTQTTVVRLDSSNAGSPQSSGVPVAALDPVVDTGRQDVVREEQRVQEVCKRWLASQQEANHAPATPPGSQVPTPALDEDTLLGVHLFGLKKVFWKGWRRTAPQPSSSSSHHLLHELMAWAAWLISCLVSWCLHPIMMAHRVRQLWVDRVAAGELVAVHPTWLSLVPGQCYCLLGPNGAGKTTTIKCLLGAVTPSEGDAVVWGNSVRHPAGLDAARRMTGVCPQFDILWPHLTALEHLMLFHDIKDIRSASKDAARDLALQTLSKVSLDKVAEANAGTFSGGMRRRLSLAIALLGDPLLLVLDEPTTGQDPISRREVWSLLSEVKVGRCVLLTTHYMEEADTLGDKIGIFVHGTLQCLGSSLRLKSILGEGLRVSVGLDRELKVQEAGSLVQRCWRVKQILNAHLEPRHGALPADQQIDEVPQVAGAEDRAHGIHYLQVVVHQHEQDCLPEVFEALQAAAEQLGIVDVQVGQASLEDVFLRVVASAQVQEASPTS